MAPTRPIPLSVDSDVHLEGPYRRFATRYIYRSARLPPPIAHDSITTPAKYSETRFVSIYDGMTDKTDHTTPCAYHTPVTTHGNVTRAKTNPARQKTNAYSQLDIPSAGVDKHPVRLRTKPPLRAWLYGYTKPAPKPGIIAVWGWGVVCRGNLSHTTLFPELMPIHLLR